MTPSRNKTKLWVLAGLVLVVVGWWLVPLVVSAQDATTFSIESIGSAVGLGNTDLKVVVIRVIRWALAFLALVAVSYMIYGGYVWMTAAGNEQRVEKAKQIILQALIGIVIVLLAWAIVSFVARTAASLSQNGNSSTEPPCVGVIGVDCPPFDPARTFNIKAIASCAAPPNYQEDVPKVSNLAVYFNRKVDVTSIQNAVTSHALNLQYCGTDPTCTSPTSPAEPDPANDDREVFVPTRPAVVNTESNYSNTQWVSNGSNAMGIYHFERPFQVAAPATPPVKDYYRLVFPIEGNAAALRDVFQPIANPLAFCRRDDGSPIPGDDLAHSVCRTDTANNVITWTFSTKDAITGAALEVAKTFPRSVDPQNPDRNVDRDATLGIKFSGAIDPYTLSTDNFTVRRINIPLTGPNFAYDRLTNLDAPLPATFFGDPTYQDTGMTIKPGGANLFEPYTWYEVTVEGVRDLCGTLQNPNPHRWIFETNANKPGVRYVYPPNEYKYACPNTKVRIVFNTSMYESGANCQPQLGSYVRDESAGTRMTQDGVPYTGRPIRVVDDYNEATDDPNDRCKVYEFGTENTALGVPRTYGMTVMTTRIIDADNNVLAYGEDAEVDPPKPWHFTTTTPDECVNPPLIDRVSPSGGAQAGQCLTVIGSNFTKQGKYADNIPYPQVGDVLTYGGLTQTDLLLWENHNIVSTIEPVGSLSTGITHPYSVTVRYPAPIGDLVSNEYDYMFNAGTGMGDAPCLISLSKYRGLPGTTLSATGKRFRDYLAPNSKVNFDHNVDLVDRTWVVSEPVTNWTDTRISSIGISTDSLLGEGMVSVFNHDNLQSNELLFTVGAEPDGGGDQYLRVEEQTQCIIPANAEDPTIFPSPNPKRGETDASLNIRIYARFTETVLASTLTAANLQLDRCADNTCASVTPVNTAITVVDGGRGFELSLLPAGTNLTQATTYRVTIRQAVAAAADPAKQLREDYSWTFTTKNNDADAPIAAVGVNGATDPNPALSMPNFYDDATGKFLYRDVPFQVNMSAHALSAKCEVINFTGNIAWAAVNPTGKNVVTVDAAVTAANNSALNNRPTTDEGRAKARATIEGKSGLLPITYNSTFCIDDSSCATSTIGESCPGSRCIQNNCTPIVNEYSPNHGAIGTWTTIKGCWFGIYVDGRSTTRFSGGPPRPEGVIPDTAICPLNDTWTNTRIIREVPPNADTGIITVVKPNPGGGPTDNWTDDGPNFTIDSTRHPNLCRIDPRSGQRGTNIVLSGKDFGAGPGNGTSYAITMTHKNWTEGDPAHVTTSGTYGDWTDAVVGGAVPDTAEIIDNNGANNTQVISNSVPSNSVVYRVREVGDGGTDDGEICLSPCNTDADVCPDVDGQPQGCAMKLSTPCCRPVPVIETYNPPAGAVNVCRNAVPTITFSRPIDGATVTAEAISYADGAAPVAPKFSVKNAGGKGEVRVSPGLLSASTLQTIRFLAPDDSLKIRSSDGVIAQVPVGVPYTFTTGADICTLSQISLEPNALYFTSRDDTDTITATALSANGEVLHNTADYSWDWSWTMANAEDCDEIACVGAPVNTETNSAVPVAVEPDANAGRSSAVVKATVTHNELKADDRTSRTARASITLDLCNYPWYDTGDETGFTDAADNCDNVGDGCQNFNFSLHYCLGQSDDDTKWLTSFDYEGSDGRGLLGAIEGVNNTLGRVKSMFFKADRDSTDAIGLLIYKNDSLLSPGDWYDANFSNALANPLSAVIGGYPAVRTGTQAYIGVTDIGDYPGGHQGLIFVMDFNSNEAEGKTKQVYDQMLKKIEFNLNLGDDEKQQLQRDTKRYQDLASIATRAETYKTAHQQYPTLSAGSYLVGISTSTWPSWQSTLGNALGRSLPIDPINKFSPVCPSEEDGRPYDTKACWNENKKKFLCPADSNIYLYKYNTDNNISLYTKMEYSGTGSFIQEPYTPCPLPSECPCFNYQYPIP